MFLNLVRVSFIRLSKNRAIIGSVLGALIIATLFSSILSGGEAYRYLEAEDVGTILSPDAMVPVNIYGSLIGVACTVVTAFFVCDYYKNRLSINIEGAVRSRAKIAMSEIVALAIGVFIIIGITAVMCILLTLISSGETGIRCSMIHIIAFIVVHCMQVFLTCMEMFVIAKIVRHHLLSIVVFVAYSIVYMLIDSGLVLILDESTGTFVSSMILPGGYLAHLVSNVGRPPMSKVLPVLIAYFVIIGILSTIACLASRRKDRI